MVIGPARSQQLRKPVLVIAITDGNLNQPSESSLYSDTIRVRVRCVSCCRFSTSHGIGTPYQIADCMCFCHAIVLHSRHFQQTSFLPTFFSYFYLFLPLPSPRVLGLRVGPLAPEANHKTVCSKSHLHCPWNVKPPLEFPGKPIRKPHECVWLFMKLRIGHKQACVPKP
jgi:hypothetical protein